MEIRYPPSAVPTSAPQSSSGSSSSSSSSSASLALVLGLALGIGLGLGFSALVLFFLLQRNREVLQKYFSTHRESESEREYGKVRSDCRSTSSDGNNNGTALFIDVMTTGEKI